MRQNGFKLLIPFLFVLFFSNVKADLSDKRPNIVIILADDLGYSDIGCYGGEIETPNIDRLASQGIRFTHFMNGAKCAPSRASLLTGLYPIESGCAGEPEQMINGITLAELLRKAGYRTLMSGKWHAKENPSIRGFDRFFGSTSGAFDYFKPKPGQVYMDDAKVLKPFIPDNPETYYTTDAFTDKAIQYLDEYKKDAKPFFLYMAYNAPHWPLQAWPEDIAKYRGKYLKGWDKIREERYERQIKMGLVKPEWKLSERDTSVGSWDNFTRKDEADLTMATYAAMVDRLDQNIGRLMQKLKEIGADDNTLILFLSDNGACAEGKMWDGKEASQKPEPPESDAKLGAEWANACNTPYRKFKRWMHNGGELTPFIARWPNGIKNIGEISFQPGHIVDFMPTLAELAGIQYPEGEHWKVRGGAGLRSDWIIQPMSGKSLLPAFRKEPVKNERMFLGYFQGGRMLTTGNWKMVSEGGDATVLHLYDFPWELYNVSSDATETRNLASEYPAMVDSLDHVFRGWIDRTDELTHITQNKYYQPRFTREQEMAELKLENDSNMIVLLKARKEIGLEIALILSRLDVEMKTTLGMEKVPMSYFGMVESGRPFYKRTEKLEQLYKAWDENIEETKTYCSGLGSVFSEVFEIQERIRVKTSKWEIEQ